MTHRREAQQLVGGAALLAVVVAGCGLVAAGCASGKGAVQSPGGAALQPAQGDALAVSLPDLDGKTVDLKALRGHPVLLDLWATWCEPCKDLLPRTQQFAQEHAARGLLTYAVNEDENPDEVAPFVKKFGLRLPVLMDTKQHLSDAVGADQLPTLVLLDKQGRIRWKHVGSSHDDTELTNALAAILAE